MMSLNKVKFGFSVILTSVVLHSCNEGQTFSGRERKMDSLLVIQKEDQESINHFIMAFNEIERNLDSVAIKQNIIFLNTERADKDLKESQKTRIIDEIKSINSLMEENVVKVEELKSKLEKSEIKNSTLKETISILNNQLLRKNEELVLLNQRLTSMDFEMAQLRDAIDTLIVLNHSKDLIINNDIKSRHLAYYVVGKSKELQAARLIEKKGGILGFGSLPALSGNFDQNKFTCIDYRHCSIIPVNCNATIVTSHPSNSYNLDRDAKNKGHIKNIVITDPDKFWGVSKYLVVVKS